MGRYLWSLDFLEKAVNIKENSIISLQKILGHSTINMTLRYAHLAPDFMASEIEVLDFESRQSPNGPRKEAYSWHLVSFQAFQLRILGTWNPSEASLCAGSSPAPGTPFASNTFELSKLT